MTDAVDTNAVLPAWPAIEDEGGAHEWVRAELLRRDLIDDTDPSRLSDKQKRAYKARREEERRVRRILEQHAWSAYRDAHVVHVGVGVFHHDTPDVDRFDAADPAARLEENDLPALKDTDALAAALDIDVPKLRWLAYHREVDTGTHYHRWFVPKRSGGERQIAAPKPLLKRVQRWINTNITEHLPVHGAAHGFLAGRSTVTNAAVHAGAKVVVKLDLEAFYPTIIMPRVKGMLRKAGYGEQVATLLALLATEAPRESIPIDGRVHHVAVGPRALPQGAPTSPSLSNAICLRLDTRLHAWTKVVGFRYTRYADDLTFSWHGSEDAPVGRLLRAVSRIVRDEGFELNRKKTRVMRHGRRQKITGLVVNGEHDQPARVPRRVVRRLRAAIKNRELGRPGQGESLNELAGMASYIHMCDPVKGRAFLDRIQKLREGETT